MALEPKPLKPSYKQPINRQRGPTAREEPQDDEQTQRDDLRRTVLENTVNERIREAIFGRQNSGIEQVWSESDDLYNGNDALNSAAATVVKTRDRAARKGESSRATIVLNITKPKTDSAVARVQEMLVPTDDKPWEIEPTPIPEVDEAVKGGMGDQVTLADGTQAPKGLVAQFVKDKAAEAAKEESDWIEDRLVEGCVYAQMRDTIKDAGRLGTGVLKGPHPVEYVDRRWKVEGETATLEIVRRTDPTSTRVKLENCFPDPACGEDIQRGEYFAERDYLTTRKLRELAGLEGYDRAAIAAAIGEGPVPAIMARADRAQRQMQGESVTEAALYEVFYYYGFMRAEDLLLLGLPDDQVDETDLALAAVPCVCTILNGRCVKATINPLESGKFPYAFFRWDRIDGQPWGRGIAWKMRTAQKGVTAAVRALLENAGLASGPQVAFIKGALQPVNGRYEIVARKLWEFEPSEIIDDIRKAFVTFNVPSMQAELLELVQFWLNMADQLTNLPMLLQGEQAAGTSPETLGGMKMLVSNATSPLRVIAKGFDDDLTAPHLAGYHDWFMERVTTPLKKFCDTRIKALGATVLVQREEAREFLTQLFAVKDDPSLKIDPAKYAAELARANGFNLKTVQYTDEEWQKKQAEMAKNPPPQDPRIQAAQIRNEGLQAQADSRAKDSEAERQFRAEQAAADRQMQAMVADVEKQVEMMRLSGQQNISLENIKAMLAKSAMDNRMKSQEMNLKLMPANPSHLGI